MRDSLEQSIKPTKVNCSDNAQLPGGVAETAGRAMFDVLPAAIYITDAEGRITYFNPACVAFSGRTPQIGTDRWCVTWKLYYPDGRPMPHDQCPMAIALKEGRIIKDAEAIAERPDGSRIWFTPYPTPLRDAQGNIVGGINMLVDITHRKRAEADRIDLLSQERAARQEAQTLQSVARMLAADLDLQSVVQKVTDAGTQLTGAQFGSFFYNVTDEEGQAFRLFALSGAPREAFEKFGLPRNTGIFGPTFRDSAILRSGDIQNDPRYGKMAPHFGLPRGHPPVRSYLAVPVISRTGQVHGGLFFGHADRDVFSDADERLIVGLAAHAAVALDNARLVEDLHREIASHQQARAALRQSEEQYRGLMTQVEAGIAQTDLTGRFTFVNDRYCGILGYERDELMTMRMQDITHPDDLGRNIEQFQRLLEKGESFAIEKRYIRRDGSVVWVQNSVSTVGDESGAIHGDATITIDITDRKRSEQLLSEQRRLLELIATRGSTEEAFDALTDAITHFQTDARAAVLVADSTRSCIQRVYSSTIPASFGQQVIGLPINDPAIGTCSTTMSRGETSACADIASSAWSESWKALCLAHGMRACLSTPIFNADHQAIGSFFICLGHARQPSEWKVRLGEFGAHVAEIALERERITQALSRQLNDMHRLHDLSVRLARQSGDVNAILHEVLNAAAELVGADGCTAQIRDAASGTLKLCATMGFDHEFSRRFEHVSADDCTTCAAVLRTGQRVLVEDLATEPQFTRFARLAEPYMLRAAMSEPLKAADGSILGVFTVYWNAPHRPDENELRLLDLYVQQAERQLERRQAEVALRQADRRKDKFLAVLAHELRNPLAPIISSIELLNTIGGGSDAETESRAVIARQARHLARLVDDLLDVSRINHDKIELRRQRVELSVVIQSAVESCRPLLGDLMHQLTLDLPEVPVWLYGDPVRLAQIFGNLLNNACKYTPENGKVHLSARCCGNEVNVAISDTGIGIPRDKLRDVFDMFSQTGRELERKHGGLGIGLHLVKRLIDLHGGSIEARSEGEGRGATFLVRLPIEPPAAAQGAVSGNGSTDRIEAAQRTKAMENGSAKNILLVDDNRDAAIALSRMLGLRGHQVQICHSGAEAVELASKQDFDIILLDIGLPKMSGYDVCRAIRSAPAGDKPQIIALTGYGAEQDRQRSTAAGFDAHLVKPIDLELLERTIHARSRMEAREKAAVGDREKQGMTNLK